MTFIRAVQFITIDQFSTECHNVTDYAECRCSECQLAECHGTLLTGGRIHCDMTIRYLGINPQGNEISGAKLSTLNIRDRGCCDIRLSDTQHCNTQHNGSQHNAKYDYK